MFSYTISEIIKTIKVIPFNGGQTIELHKKDLDFSYRNSILQKEKLIVLSAKIKLEPGHPKQELNRITSNHLTHRLETQPYNQHSCGSVFRNPEPLKAAKLIEELGLKGFRVGGAEISKIHANFIVNSNNASANDIKRLITIIQRKVNDSYGVLLHPEVKTYGF